MTPLKKIRICLCLNISLLLFISSCIIIFASDSIYFRYGPSNNFLLTLVKHLVLKLILDLGIFFYYV